MTTHIKKQIRDAVVARLKAGVTTVLGEAFNPNNVFANRVTPVEVTPSITVMTIGEDIQAGNIGYPSMLQRSLYVYIACRVKRKDNYDDALDDMQLQIEKALSSQIEYYTLNGLIDRIVLQNARNEYDSMSDNNVGEMTLTFVADYKTLNTTPETPY
jgi:hypothetical protein